MLDVLNEFETLWKSSYQVDEKFLKEYEEFLVEEYGSEVLDFLREKSKEVKIFYKEDYIEVINKFRNNE